MPTCSRSGTKTTRLTKITKNKQVWFVVLVAFVIFVPGA